MLYFTIQNRLQDGTSKVSEAAGARWRFYRRMWSDWGRMWSDVVGLSSNRLSIGGSIQGVTAEIWRFQISWQAHYLVRLQGDFILAPRIGNDVSYVTQIRDDIHFAWQAQYLVMLEGDFTCSTHWKWRFIYVTQISDDIHFAWQAQYLVMLEGDFTCSTHWKWRFICDADQWWHSFCVAGAVFGEVGRWFLLRSALKMTFQSRSVGLVRSSTGVVQSSTGVELCSTEWYWSRTL